MNILNKSQNVRAIHDTDSSLPLSISQAGMLGGNISDVSDYNTAWYYLDVINSSRGFVLAGQTPGLLLDANMWPAQSGMNVISAQNGGHYEQCPPGNYKMSYDILAGQCIVTWGGGYFTQSSAVLNANGDTTYTGILTVNGNILVMSFSNAIRNIKIMRPGYELSEQRRFNPDIVKYYSRFSCLRYMDFLMSNRGNSGTPAYGTWATRTTNNTHGKYDELHYNLNGTIAAALNPGRSWEDVIMLSNLIKEIPGNILSSIWVNIVYSADDDYILKVCTMMRDTLNPNLSIYLELGNEAWNSAGGFTGCNGYFANLAADDFSLSAIDGQAGSLALQQRAYAKRVREMALIAESVFGVGSLNNKIKVTLGCQSFDAQDKLQYLSIAFLDRPVNSYIYAITGAPYFGLGDTTTSALTTTTQLIAACRLESVVDRFGKVPSGDETLPAIFHTIRNARNVANVFGVKMVAYEGGPGWDKLSSYPNQVLAYNANFDPAMVQLITDFIMGMFNNGLDLFNYFTVGPAINSIGQNGNWSGNQYIDSVDPKLQGVLNAQRLSVPSATDIVASNKITKNGNSILNGYTYGRISRNLANSGSAWYAPISPFYYLSGNFVSSQQPWIDYGVYIEQAGNYSATICTFSTCADPTVAFTISLDSSQLTVINTPVGNYPYSAAFKATIPLRANNAL